MKEKGGVSTSLAQGAVFKCLYILVLVWFSTGQEGVCLGADSFLIFLDSGLVCQSVNNQ